LENLYFERGNKKCIITTNNKNYKNELISFFWKTEKVKNLLDEKIISILNNKNKIKTKLDFSKISNFFNIKFSQSVCFYNWSNPNKDISKWYIKENWIVDEDFLWKIKINQILLNKIQKIINDLNQLKYYSYNIQQENFVESLIYRKSINIEKK